MSTMPHILYVSIWLVGSLAGYFLARVVWRKFVSPEIGHDDTIFLTLSSIVLSWFLVVGSTVSLAAGSLFRGMDDTQAYWFGKKSDELRKDKDSEDKKKKKS